MTTPLDIGGALALFGASYRTAPVDVLEGLVLSEAQCAAILATADAAGIADVLVLSTCNRIELYGTTTTDGALEQVFRQVVANLPDEEVFYSLKGRDAIQHLFRVTAGVDSMVLGEAQILGQVRSAFEVLCQRNRPSPFFERVVQTALRVAAKSRAETAIGQGAVSVASAAVHLAGRIYADLSQQRVAVVGAGDTARLVVEHFARHRPKEIFVLNRTPERAMELARMVGGKGAGLETLSEVIAQVDVLASAVDTAEPIINGAMLEAARHRRSRSLAILDLGLPRNVAPDVRQLANVFLHDLDALKKVMDSNLERRRREIPRVEAIIEDEIDRLLDWHRASSASPLIAALRESVESMRLLEVEKVCRGLPPEVRQAVDYATRAVVNKLLHGPTTSIKEFARDKDLERLEVVEQVFRHFRDQELEETPVVEVPEPEKLN